MSGDEALTLNDRESVDDLLCQFELGVVSSIQSLGNAGGFSGAQLWQVDCDRGLLCLRQWPVNSQVDLDWIHAILMTARSNGIPVPVPLESRNNQTLIDCRGRSWELAPWMPGHADFNQAPSLDRLKNVIGHLANFHECTREFNLMIQSPSVGQRYELLLQTESVAKQIRSKLSRTHTISPTIGIEEFATRLLPAIQRSAKNILPEFERFGSKRILLGAAIRDIHHDHVFFEGDTVSGIVDFGSLQVDTYCLDIARLVGSLQLHKESEGELAEPPWEEALEFYSSFHQLTGDEIELIGLLHKCNSTLGALNWLNWILVEQRNFEDWTAIEQRLEAFAIRLNA